MDCRSDAPRGRVRRVGVAEALAGIDLAGSERRITGLAVGDSEGRVLMVSGVRSDEEIIEALRRYGVLLVAVDAPLGHARGYRDVDLAARRRGFKLLPPGWRGMRMLVDRALRLKSRLSSMNIRVVETHPRSALLNTGCSYEDWPRCLSRHLVLEGVVEEELGRDLVDALIALAVARAYILGGAEAIRGRDGVIWLLPRGG